MPLLVRAERLGFALRCLDPREERVCVMHARECRECVRAVQVLEREGRGYQPNLIG